MNYVDHCKGTYCITCAGSFRCNASIFGDLPTCLLHAEQGFPIPDEPIIFSKLPRCVANPGDPIQLTPIIKVSFSTAEVIGIDFIHFRN